MLREVTEGWVHELAEANLCGLDPVTHDEAHVQIVDDCEDEFTEVGQYDLEERVIEGHFRCIRLTLPYFDLVLRGCHQVLSRVHYQERDND